MSPCNRIGICIRLKIGVLWVRFPPGVPPTQGSERVWIYTEMFIHTL